MIELEFHHVGYACEDLAKEKPYFESLGYLQEGSIFDDPIQKVRGCFMIAGASRIELLQPAGDQSPLRSFLKKGVRMYHLAYLSTQLDAKVRDFVAQGAIALSKPQPAVAFANRRICFLMLRNQLLIELIEAP